VGLRPPGQVARRSRAPRIALPRLLAATVALLALVLPAAAHADAPGAELVGYVNALRAAGAIPAGITENPAWSSGCALHDHYGAVNGVLTHAENASAPGFTGAGSAAGAAAIVYSGSHWTAADNPFEHAPIHLHQLLAPRLDVMGAAEGEGYGCATTVASRGRPAPHANLTYTYPADGATGWRVGETAQELPITPGEQLGIAQGTATGPYLYVLFDGPGIAVSDAAKVSHASLTGPAGPVDLLVADNTTPGLEGFLPVGAELIPRERLAPDTRYTATVQASVGSTRFTHRWSFQTGPGPGASASSQAGGGSPHATAARSALAARAPRVSAYRRAATIQVLLRCPHSCLVRGIGRLSSDGASRWLPYARAGRLVGGGIRLRFRLSPAARHWLAFHARVHFGLSVSGLFVRPLSAALPYARTSGSSSAYLPLASSVPSSG
jgi:hypothetical protein